MNLPIAIPFRRLHPDAQAPLYATADAAGADLSLVTTVVLRPGERRLLSTGISLAIPTGHEGQIRPRSGLALDRGITILNSPGTIDADYRGEIGVIAINLSDVVVTLEAKTRIAQLVIAPVARGRFSEQDDLPAPNGNRTGGFGSTGGLGNQPGDFGSKSTGSFGAKTKQKES